jgi:hypothetical protein
MAIHGYGTDECDAFPASARDVSPVLKSAGAEEFPRLIDDRAQTVMQVAFLDGEVSSIHGPLHGAALCMVRDISESSTRQELRQPDALALAACKRYLR